MTNLEILIWDVWIHFEGDGFTRFGSIPASELEEISKTLEMTPMGTALIWR